MKNVIIRYKDFILKVNATETNTHIENSYKVKSLSDMCEVLKLIKKECKSKKLAINKLSIDSMIDEWRVHNLLYDFHIQRSRTKDVDLNTDNAWYYKLAYYILSPFYLHFV